MTEVLWWTMMTTNQKGNLKDAGELDKGQSSPWAATVGDPWQSFRALTRMALPRPPKPAASAESFLTQGSHCIGGRAGKLQVP